MKKFKSKIYTCIIIAAVLCSTLTAAVFAQDRDVNYYKTEDIASLSDGIIKWKANAVGANSAMALVEEKLSPDAGDSLFDWYALGIARLPKANDFPVYKNKLISKILDIYSSGSIDTVAVTDFHRISLTLLALGGNPSKINKKETPHLEKDINLISDHTYNRGVISPLNKQGISGWLWALITLDSMQYSIPKESHYSREDIIKEILSYQKSGGAFSLAGTSNSDPDITAMAVQALSPYYNSEKVYTYIRIADSAKQQSTVSQAIDNALMKLSSVQGGAGDFSSWGSRNVQTGAQVILALCCLGIDPQKDTRFIKNGKTLLDGLTLYQCEDKGFSNTYPAKSSNSKASEQVLYTLAALQRHMSGMRRLYDMRPEQNTGLKSQISTLVSDISNIDKKTSKDGLNDLDRRYKAIAENERMYVYNYTILYDALKNFKEPQESETPSRQNSSAIYSVSSFSKDEVLSKDESSETLHSEELSKDNFLSITFESEFSSVESLSESSENKYGRSVLLIVFAIFAIIIILGIAIFIYIKRKGGEDI